MTESTEEMPPYRILHEEFPNLLGQEKGRADDGGREVVKVPFEGDFEAGLQRGGGEGKGGNGGGEEGGGRKCNRYEYVQIMCTCESPGCPCLGTFDLQIRSLPSFPPLPASLPPFYRYAPAAALTPSKGLRTRGNETGILFPWQISFYRALML